jgi:hypothetical protein
MLINIVLSCTVIALIYRLHREKQFFLETIQYYSDLSAGLAKDLQQQKQLAAELAHDLKSPLAGIISSAESLNLVGTELPASYHECLKLMRDSGRTNLRLVTNFIEFIADRKVKLPKASLPKNRKDLFVGLLAPDQFNSEYFDWQAVPLSPHLKLSLRPFACAFAEICDFALAEAIKHNHKLRVVENLFEGSQELGLTITPAPTFSCNETKSHYVLALKVLERLGVRFIEGACTDQGNYLDLYVPTYELEEGSASMHCVVESRAQKDAETLVQSTVQQVHSAKLSVVSLKDIDNRVEEVETREEVAEVAKGYTV